MISVVLMITPIISNTRACRSSQGSADSSFFCEGFSLTSPVAFYGQPRRSFRDVTTLPQSAVILFYASPKPGNLAGAFQNFTLEYSTNFHRHVVRDAATGDVLESFAWLEEALDKYSTSLTLLPLTIRLQDETCNTTMKYPTDGQPDEEEYSDPWMLVAGGGLNESNAYPINTNTLGFDLNLKAISGVLQSRLKWFPSQVDNLLRAFPIVKVWPAMLLAERIDFMLAPFPQPDVFARADGLSFTCDWPQQFYVYGLGAGMSVAQVSHALQILPDVFLRSCVFDVRATTHPILPFLYTQTPAVVLQMATAQLEYLQGAAAVDVAAYAYFHWKGWEWQQCRACLQALPMTVSCSSEPSWELYEKAGFIRKQLLLASMWYLRMRLHLGPHEILAMIKTHSRLSSYPMAQLKRSLDNLQSSLRLSSPVLQSLVLRMPSLLGMSISGLDNRIQFWTRQVGLTLEQVRDVAGRQPALLQYSTQRNLEAKLDFFVNDLKISPTSLAKITLKEPQLWGRSLEGHLKPMSESFEDFFDGQFVPADFGAMLSQAPELGRCHWQGNLEKKLRFLQARLDLRPDELRAMVQRTPRVLMQSLEASLEPKLHLLETVSISEGRQAVRQNPSLLLNGQQVLRSRLERAGNRTDVSLVDALQQSKVANAGRPKKVVWLFRDDGSTVDRRFADIQEAADFVGVSKSRMYVVLRKNQIYRGRLFVYATADSSTATISRMTPLVSGTSVTTTDVVTTTLAPPAHPKVTKTPTDNIRPSILSNVQQAPTILGTNVSRPTHHELTIFVAGRAFPPENTIRGRRRSGGLAICVPQFTTLQWRQVCQVLWKGQRLRLLPDSRTLLLGYPYTRPSRPRCSMYAFREALRVAQVWWECTSACRVSQGQPWLPGKVHIVTEASSRIVNLVGNHTSMLRWGSFDQRQAFVYDGPGPTHQYNIDLLYPLARTYYRLVHNGATVSTEATGSETVSPIIGNATNVSNATNVTVSVTWERSWQPETQRVAKGALLAAQLMYGV
jgi:hypothetical protein